MQRYKLSIVSQRLRNEINTDPRPPPPPSPNRSRTAVAPRPMINENLYRSRLVLGGQSAPVPSPQGRRRGGQHLRWGRAVRHNLPEEDVPQAPTSCGGRRLLGLRYHAAVRRPHPQVRNRRHGANFNLLLTVVVIVRVGLMGVCG